MNQRWAWCFSSVDWKEAKDIRELVKLRKNQFKSNNWGVGTSIKRQDRERRGYST